MAQTLFTKYGNIAPATQRVEADAEGETFLSYGTRIARKGWDGTVTLFPSWNYSQTTTYYRNQFLGENTAETRKKIESGEYKMA